MPDDGMDNEALQMIYLITDKVVWQIAKRINN